MYLEFYMPEVIWDSYTERYDSYDRKVKAFLEPNIIYDKEILPRTQAIFRIVLKEICRKIYGKTLGSDLKLYHFDKEGHKVYHTEQVPEELPKEKAKIRRMIVAHRIFNTHILFTYAKELEKLYPEYPIKLEHLAREAKSLNQFSKIYAEYKKVYRKTIFSNEVKIKTYCPLEALGRIQTAEREIFSFNTLYNYCFAKFVIEDPLMAVMEERTKILSEEIKINIQIKLEEFEEQVVEECEAIQEAIEMILMEIDTPYSLAKAMLQQRSKVSLDLPTIRAIKNAGFTIDEFVDALRFLENQGYAVHKDGEWVATDALRKEMSIRVEDRKEEGEGGDTWDWENWI